MNEIIIDASKGIMGRIASYSAKQALLGKKVIVVNCNDLLISGKPRSTIKFYLEKRARGGASLNGPFFPKDSEKIMKRTIKGMLPHLKGRGIQVLKNVRCYNKVPQEYEDSKKISLTKKISSKTITLKGISKEL